MSRLEELIAELCPDGVEYKTLGEVAHYSKERIAASFVDSHTYVGVDNLLPDKKGKTESTYVPNEGRLIRFVKGDILIGNIRPYLKKIWLAESEGGTNGDVLVIRKNNSEELLSDYLYYILSSDRFFDYDVQYSKGAKMPRGDKETILKYLIPLPPLEVQREIVCILDAYSERVAELTDRLAAELGARKKQYEYYRELLLVPENVEWTTLDKISTNLDSKRIPITKGKRTSGHIPYYGASGIVDYVSDYIFDGDYLLVSEDGANLLARTTPIAFSISGKTWVNNHAHILAFENTFLRRYVEIYLNSINLSPYLSTAAQPKLTKEKLNKIPIPVPDMKIVERIVAILDRFDKLCNDISEGIPAEIEARRKQYEHYRDRLLTFKEKTA